MKKDYKTAGKRALLDFLTTHPDRQFTAEEICLAVNGSLSGKSSTYRRLSALCAEGSVKRFDGAGERRVYQYTGRECDCSCHFHEMCVNCGQIRHLDDLVSTELAAKLFSDSGFEINRERSVLYGVCAACRRRENAHA